MSESRTLKVGIPKGSLSESTVDLFNRAGFHLSISSRGYYPSIDDPELRCIMFRAQEMSRYVEDGVVDVGLTGYDWIRENGSDVHEVCELVYSKATSKPARWVLAVPNESKVTKPEDLEGGIVATELVQVTKRYFESRGVNVRVEFSWGATEVKARLLDAIVELTETGSSLRENHLRIIDEILISTTRLIANKQAYADPWKRDKIDSLALLLRGAIEAKAKVGLKLNVARADLEKVLSILPAERSPTVSSLADERFVAVEVILEAVVERQIVPLLQKAGASGIIVYPLNKVIP
ncbi:MAG TPA: ATP phosphoribosyltransferase [Phycisphaerae bacterium]|nr:ATP phosphoribosyltransferase [Phycisphaerae bacterium]HOB74363.1 ATP phosphoribosyltransferase [Phycisphaerae bacterium]HOJ54518.1 ATP phosphoribosyltransferase [Phycisphaerae bacterium]HOL26547.1 ATP phosphoribosyltransferase [Phycisphaerae bacterium]HPP20946.1 ATP phosphoribosyltransferase [Phycisphaerae bacterium]